MEKSGLSWEDIIKFEEVKGYGEHIWKNHDQYYYVTEEGGIAVQRVVYELPKDLFELLERNEKSMADIHFKLRYDSWPPTEEEKNRIKKERAKDRPIVLISNPKNQLLFTQEELEELIPIAEQQWIDWKGKLPDDYVSPLEK
ncbi:TPA: hypothetical protein U1V35_000740 [Streptococcus suis]|nr:hypothetical protein [Streptococcus suis]HEM3973166.1 hypothetical protein [Streptococcus suis]HEM3976867.1 hypothetical protein [Streptococcus suis]HEO8616623.1 hypothetical protein [Streptococcus suis]